MKPVPILAAVLVLAAVTHSSDRQSQPLDLNTLEYGKPVDLGPPMKAVAITDGGYGHLPDGTPIVAMVTKGAPGVLFVYNARTREKVFQSAFPGTDDNSSATEIARDGTVYVGGSGGNLYALRPGAQKMERLGELDQVMLAVREAPDGRIFVGTFPGGRLGVWDPSTRKMTDLGQVVAGEQYARSLAFHGETLYIGVGTRPHLIRYNTRTQSKQEIALPASLTEGGTTVTGLSVAGNRLFGMAGKSNVFVLDLATHQLVTTIPDGLADASAASPERNGKTYFARKDNKLYEYDLATDRYRLAEGFRSTSYTRDFGWLDVGDPSPSLVTVSWSGGMWAYNPDRKTYTGWDLEVEGQGVGVQAMEKGPDGALYTSGYPGGVGGRYDIRTKTLTNFNLGQAEGIGFLDDTAWFGIYPGARIFSMDLKALPLKANQAFDIEEAQDRPFAVATGGGKVYFGTVATYGALGGAITVYDPQTKQHTTTRNVIPEQSVIRLIYRDGLLYGSTTVWGGLGIEPTETAARVFVWDPKTGKVLRSATPKHPAFDTTPKAINGLEFGPDGKLWGAWQGTLFRMDPKSLKVESAVVLKPSTWKVSHSWEPIALRWSKDGLLYTTLASQLTVFDPKSMKHRVLAQAGRMEIGEDNALYYSWSTRLYRMALPESR